MKNRSEDGWCFDQASNLSATLKWSCLSKLVHCIEMKLLFSVSSYWNVFVRFESLMLNVLLYQGSTGVHLNGQHCVAYSSVVTAL